jgi:sugar lactone lactonase YvrE
LWWVDILGMTVHLSDPSTGATQTWSVPERVGAVVGRESGGVVALLQSGFAAVDEAGIVSWLAQVGADDPSKRFNDGKCDASGRLVGGTMSYQRTPGAASLYRLELDHTVTRLTSGLTVSNGLAWSADGTRLYLIDSGRRSLRTYVYGEDAPLSLLEEVVLGPGVPDGMAVDEDGFVWVAMYGAGIVQQFTAGGQPGRTVTLPVSGVTSCIFGGSRFDELYVTTSAYSLTEDERGSQPDAGSIFVCRPGVVGCAEPLYAG